MKVTLYLAVSIDGYIASKDHSTPWTDAEWKEFSAKVKEYKQLLVGRKTFEIMTAQDALTWAKNPKVMVVSKKKSSNPQFVSSPQKALALLKKRGCKKVLVAGGATLATSMLGMIDEIYLDVEPVLLGKGVNLFNEHKATMNMRLLGTKRIGKDGVQLHYAVVR